MLFEGREEPRFGGNQIRPGCVLLYGVDSIARLACRTFDIMTLWKHLRALLFAVGVCALMQVPRPAHAQDAAPPAPPASSSSSGVSDSSRDSDSSNSSSSSPHRPSLDDPPDKRVFGVLPNYRTVDASVPFRALSSHVKFTIASKDSFDYPLVFLGGVLAAVGQLANQNPSFGQGLGGYARRLGTSYGDQAIGNMMTEAIFPSLLREDPRYFRLGKGSTASRAVYAATRIFVTRTDAGAHRFNFAEVLGNAAAAAISNAYYPDGRTASNNAAKLAEQLGTDALSQVLKEFWPDIKHKLFARRHGPGD